MIVPELIRQRWSMPNLWNDCVSGIIIATFVIFSFLSLVRFFRDPISDEPCVLLRSGMTARREAHFPLNRQSDS